MKSNPFSLAFLVFVAIAIMPVGCRDDHAAPGPSKGVSVTVLDDARVAEQEKAAAVARKDAAEARLAAQKAENELNLGKEAGKASLARAAVSVGWVGAVVFAASLAGLIVGQFVGGIARKTCYLGFAVAAGCIWLRFFILAHGYFVSETVSWVVLIALGVVVAVLGAVGVRFAWDTWNAHSLLAKRASQGADGADGIAILPVPLSVKSALHDAWNAVRAAPTTPPSPAAAIAVADAQSLLQKFKLPVPSEAPATA